MFFASEFVFSPTSVHVGFVVNSVDLDVFYCFLLTSAPPLPLLLCITALKVWDMADQGANYFSVCRRLGGTSDPTLVWSSADCVEQCPWEAVSRSPIQEIVYILWNPKVCYSVHRVPPLDRILNQMNQKCVSSCPIFRIHYNTECPDHRFFWVYNFLSKFHCGLPWWHYKYSDDIRPRSTLLEACLVLP
jgi:hypothetical protein